MTAAVLSLCSCPRRATKLVLLGFTVTFSNAPPTLHAANSVYVEPIREEVALWVHKLALLADTLEEWVLVQRHWLFLENIFNSVDMSEHLPREAAQVCTPPMSYGLF